MAAKEKSRRQMTVLVNDLVCINIATMKHVPRRLAYHPMTADSLFIPRHQLWS